jgi:glycosyltransferase involved in cell wall biosynthesis
MNREDQVSEAIPPTGADGPIARHPVICVSHGFQSNYERGFCNGLAARAVVVTLIGSDRTDVVGLLPGVRMVNLRGSQEESRPAWAKLLNMIRYHARLLVHVLLHRRSIVHVTGLIDSPWLAGVLEGCWFRAIARRYVLTIHNLLPHDSHTPWRRFAHRWCYRIPHRLVVHTVRMKAELCKSFGIEPARVVVMEHGIEPWPLHEPPALQRPPTSAPPVILLFGKVARYKGVDLLLDALRDVAFSYRLVIAGACPSAPYRVELQAALDRHPHRDRIEWRDGFVAESEMHTLFEGASLVALPYRHIDQSGVLFQALRFGVPILATRVGQFDSYVTEGVGELAEPNDVASLVQALHRWELRRSSFSPRRIREVGTAFEWTSTVTALSATYL